MCCLELFALFSAIWENNKKNSYIDNKAVGLGVITDHDLDLIFALLVLKIFMVSDVSLLTSGNKIALLQKLPFYNKKAIPQYTSISADTAMKPAT